jgi:hypothetical protein
VLTIPNSSLRSACGAAKHERSAPRSRLVAVFGALSILSGCATENCAVQKTFFKPQLIAGKAEFNRYFYEAIEIHPTEDSTLKLLVCDRGQTRHLCIEVYLAEGLEFQFTDPRLRVEDRRSGSLLTLPIAKVTYEMMCKGPTLESGKCESPTASPLIGDGRIEKRRLRAMKSGGEFVYLDSYEFSPEFTFKGAPIELFWGLKKIWRRYVAISDPLPPSFDKEFEVAVPDFRIVNRTFEFPRVAFTHVTENVCVSSRPRSLQ